jgi:hypothetical protein
MQRNSQRQNDPRIEPVNEIDLGLRIPQLHGDGDTSFMSSPSGKINMESQK